jgi:multimeric flavodoxin WrbA
MAPRVRVAAFNCSLKSESYKETSSTDALLGLLMKEFAKLGAEGSVIRAVDRIKPGVRSDEGAGDDWPKLRTWLLAADILVIGTPIWLGQPSSVSKRVLERMDAFLDEKDGRSRQNHAFSNRKTNSCHASSAQKR